jgi:translation elongation factor EF-Tu-like GTPase
MRMTRRPERDLLKGDRAPQTGEPTRFHVLDVVRVQGRAGPLVVGRLESGRIRPGDDLVLPSAGGDPSTVTVLGIDFNRHPDDRAILGLVLGGPAADQLDRGQMLTSRSSTG